MEHQRRGEIGGGEGIRQSAERQRADAKAEQADKEQGPGGGERAPMRLGGVLQTGEGRGELHGVERRAQEHEGDQQPKARLKEADCERGCGQDAGDRRDARLEANVALGEGLAEAAAGIDADGGADGVHHGDDAGGREVIEFEIPAQHWQHVLRIGKAGERCDRQGDHEVRNAGLLSGMRDLFVRQRFRARRTAAHHRAEEERHGNAAGAGGDAGESPVAAVLQRPCAEQGARHTADRHAEAEGAHGAVTRAGAEITGQNAMRRRCDPGQGDGDDDARRGELKKILRESGADRCAAPDQQTHGDEPAPVESLRQPRHRHAEHRKGNGENGDADQLRLEIVEPEFLRRGLADGRDKRHGGKAEREDDEQHRHHAFSSALNWRFALQAHSSPPTATGWVVAVCDDFTASLMP